MKIRPDHRPVDCGHDQDRKRASLKPLLAFHILVTGKKHVKAFAFDQIEQHTVLDTAPLHSDNGVYLM